MIIFYALVMMHLSARVVYFISENFLNQLSMVLYYMGSACKILEIAVGVCHSQSLRILIFDLASVKCKIPEEYNKLKDKIIYF